MAKTLHLAHPSQLFPGTALDKRPSALPALTKVVKWPAEYSLLYCRLNFRLKTACESDIAALCGDVCPPTQGGVCGGRVLRCLTEKQDSIKVGALSLPSSEGFSEGRSPQEGFDKQVRCMGLHTRLEMKRMAQCASKFLVFHSGVAMQACPDIRLFNASSCNISNRV